MFITCSNYSRGTFSAEFLFLEHLLLNTRLLVNYFLMNWISQSFNISDLIISHSQVSDLIDLLKTLGKIQRKTPVPECNFNKIAILQL